MFGRAGDDRRRAERPKLSPPACPCRARGVRRDEHGKDPLRSLDQHHADADDDRDLGREPPDIFNFRVVYAKQGLSPGCSWGSTVHRSIWYYNVLTPLVPPAPIRGGNWGWLDATRPRIGDTHIFFYLDQLANFGKRIVAIYPISAVGSTTAIVEEIVDSGCFTCDGPLGLTLDSEGHEILAFRMAAMMYNGDAVLAGEVFLACIN